MKKTIILIILLFVSICSAGCVFVYNTGQGTTFNIDDKDNPDVHATGKLK